MDFLDIDIDNVIMQPEERELLRHIGELQATFETICFMHPRLVEAHRTFEMMRDEVMKARFYLRKRGDTTGEGLAKYPALIQPVIAQSGMGKTTNAQTFVEGVRRREGHTDRTVPAIYTELRPDTLVRTFFSDLLKGFGCNFPEVGTPEEKRTRMEHFATLRPTDIMFIDEMHNIVNQDESASKHTVYLLRTLKSITNRAQFAIIAMGTEELLASFCLSREIRNRCRPPILIYPADLSTDEGATLILGYIGKLDDACARKGITKGESGLLADDLPACFAEISMETWEGVTGSNTGVISKLVRHAIEPMVRRVAAHPETEREIITREDLANATAGWAIPLGVCKTNPFRNGPSKLIRRQ
ncbi:TniB family NTP-binding protein [Microvirga sp. P5_D2]